LVSSGKKFKKLVAESKPLQIVGTVNAYSAIMAEKVGHQSIYLSGGGVAASSLGVPDLGITTLSDVLEDAKRITQATSLPLFKKSVVDIDQIRRLLVQTKCSSESKLQLTLKRILTL